MSGAVGFLILLPLALPLGAAGLVGYGLVKGIQKLMEPGRARPAQADNSQRIAAVRQRVRDEIGQELSAIEQRQGESERIAQTLKGALGDAESRMQEGLRSQQEAFARKLQDQRGEYVGLLQDQERSLSEKLQREQGEREKAFASLQGQIDTIMADATRREDIAHTFLSDVEAVVKDIDLIPHHRFAPGEMDKVRRQLTEARQSLLAGMPEAALSRAQTAYHDAVNIRWLVAEKEQEFLSLRAALLQESGELLEEIQTNRTQIVDFGDDGEKSEFELDVDHWSKGEIQAIVTEVQAIQARLAQEKMTITIDALRGLLSESTLLRPKIAEAVLHARENLVASQARANIAELAANSLSAQGFDPVDAAYEGEDERNAYTVKLRNIAGGEVVAVISPVEGEPGKSSILVNNYDETFMDEATIQQRAREVIEALQSEGVQVTKPQCHGNAKPEYRDIDSVRQRKVSQSKVSVRAGK